MNIERLPNGNLLVPCRAEDEGAIGDGVEEIVPGTPEYEAWMKYLENFKEDLNE